MKRLLALLLVAAATAFAGLTVNPSAAADTMRVASASELSGRVIHLALNKSVVIDLPETVTDVLVSNPAIADAVLRSNQRIYLIGVATGETNIFLFGDGNREISRFEVVVSRDTVGVESLIQEVVPDAAIKVQTIGESLVLTGTAPSPEAATKAVEVATKFFGDASRVVNMITIAGADQVNLRVVVAEVKRTTAKQLGVDFNINASIGGVAFNPVTSTTGILDTGGLTSLLSNDDFSATIRALQRDGVLRSLAEPNLTAVSGDDASFLVGGEIAVPVSRDETGIVYGYKPFGVGLGFTPVVLSSGRISLRIKTEISEVDTTLEVAGFPGFKSRKAETTVELPSGGAIAIGGLIQDEVRQTYSGVPGLMKVPILGTLFRSRDFQRDQTELVIFVTPYLVKSVRPSELTRPDKNLEMPNDAQGLFLSQVNRVYRSGSPAPGTYYGNYGFSYD